MVEVETSKNNQEIYNHAIVHVSPEWKEIQKAKAVFQKLYKYWILDDVQEIYRLTELMDMRYIGDTQKLRRVLKSYLELLFDGQFDRRLIVDQVCPSCFSRSLVDTAKNDGEEIKKTCSNKNCGYELENDYASFQDYDQSLARDVTFAPVSHLNDTDGAGGTFHPNNTREVRDHKSLIFDIVNADNITYSDFVKDFPKIAEQFGEVDANGCSKTIPFGDWVFCRVGGFVRKAPKKEYEAFWHGRDALLRRSILCKQLNFKGQFSKEKIYAMGLCKKYGYATNGGDDQAFINTLGLEIEKYKPFVERRDRHLNFHLFVETLFFRTLCRFDKRKGFAAQIKGELRIDKKLLKFLDAVDQVFERDSKSDEVEGEALLSALVQFQSARALPSS
jgi:hypothetical protein